MHIVYEGENLFTHIQNLCIILQAIISGKHDKKGEANVRDVNIVFEMEFLLFHLFCLAY